MIIQKILNEYYSDILYHFTGFTNIYNIIKTNTFSLTPTMSREIDSVFNKNKMFYASFARSKLSSYGNNSTTMACLVVDKNKLKQFKIVPVDYYQTKLLTNEMEDRVLTDKPYIKNFVNYIISVDIFISPKYYEKLPMLKKIKHLCDSLNIQLRFFKDSNDFTYSKNFLSDKSLDDFLIEIENEYEIRPDDNSYDNKQIDPFINLMKGVRLDDEDTKQLLYYVKYDYGVNDIATRLKYAMHTGYKSEAAKELPQVARRLKLKTIRDIANFIKQKYSNK